MEQRPLLELGSLGLITLLYDISNLGETHERFPRFLFPSETHPGPPKGKTPPGPPERREEKKEDGTLFTNHPCPSFEKGGDEVTFKDVVGCSVQGLKVKG